MCRWPASCALAEVEWKRQESTRIRTCVVLKIAPGGAVNTLCVSGQHMTMSVDVE